MEEEKRTDRLRDRDIHFKTTRQEYDRIRERMEQTEHTTLSSYLIELGTNGFILNVDYSSLDDLCYEIHKIGVNINQIAHRVNAGDLPADVAVQEINIKMDAIVDMVKKQFYKFP
ncbi:MAG: MobC family plasmid mobilization relaxosome protein [Roseburia sp.]|nr:MobC family plasmid mobilization relaxosome protein [Roseburia sp.]